MWKLFLIFGLSFFLLQPMLMTTANIPSTLEEAPPYAKWGRVAMQETKKKYPDAAIIDYLHVGKETENSDTTEKFKLWLRGKEKEFGVYVYIRFHTETEEIVKITMEETDR